MEVNRILAEIDAQIAKLQQARVLLGGSSTTAAPAVAKKAVGRPRKIVAAPTVTKSTGSSQKKRNLSPEARKRIADAQKKRWAERRKSS
ncbi:hypothetical protein Terro_1606 [Terriglobus roseus DSM 18391]|uniref:Uncharacterized protein n=1 Tax=Terriglobus roseus (strain DSM 18391 / NRRL B-41598 / KBS 63) TaxID=926566 RepID=I3ZF94_TERRK|nr:hypothetical protein [Terriglobus roseus]AFL87912.1 hypothetical protein Terro_1606 [Terriglobus roseus DSM 18391]